MSRTSLQKTVYCMHLKKRTTVRGLMVGSQSMSTLKVQRDFKKHCQAQVASIQTIHQLNLVKAEETNTLRGIGK